MEFGEEGGMELKSEKKVFKKGRRQRKRFALKDLEKYNPEIVSSGAEGSWEVDFEDIDNDAITIAESNVRHEGVNDNMETNIPSLLVKEDLDDYVSCVREDENVMASLVAQAQKARSLCQDSTSHPRRRKQSTKSVGNKMSLPSFTHDRSHIVYTSEINPNLSPDNKQRAATPTSTTIYDVALHPARVILKSGETTPGNLRAKFGRFYAEAESEPRRFMIDVTEDVQSLVCPYRDAELSAVFTSFLVFVHDGVYDEGLDTFKVIFNSNCCPETIDFKENIPFREISLEEIMNRFARTVLDKKEKNLLNISSDQVFDNAKVSLFQFVNSPVNVRASNCCFVDEIRKESQAEVKQEEADFSMSLDRVVRNMDYDIFCDICYENINPTQTMDVCGTKLSKCSHIFCDDCWRSHLRAKLKDGSLKMKCPGYDCDETVGPVTMLSVLHVSEVSKFFQRKFEEETDSSTNSRWCPNRECGRVIKLDTERSTNEKALDVTCYCGHEFCFSCLSHPHWPATCEQAEKYDEKLLTLKSLKISADDSNSDKIPPSEENEVVELEGRICPICSNFYERGDGCSHMTCKCGHSFYWECLKEWTFPHKYCFSNPSVICKLKFRHIVIPQVFSLYPEDRKTEKSGGSRRKATLYEKAAHQRQEVHGFKVEKEVKEMVKKIEHVCQKDLHLKREILSISGVEINDTDNAGIIHLKVATHVTKFLRSCCELKRALHHVAEFTFVLLQDTADSVDKRRALRLANDLSGYCSFIRSILESGQRQDMGAAVKRLADIQTWAKRALTILLATVNNLKH